MSDQKSSEMAGKCSNHFGERRQSMGARGLAGGKTRDQAQKVSPDWGAMVDLPSENPDRGRADRPTVHVSKNDAVASLRASLPAGKTKEEQAEMVKFKPVGSRPAFLLKNEERLSEKTLPIPALKGKL